MAWAWPGLGQDKPVVGRHGGNGKRNQLLRSPLGSEKFSSRFINFVIGRAG
jgi:hypothetical protein